jgi:hypothetical protein
MRVTGTIGPEEALAIYLQDHHAGAQAGVALARRAASNQRGGASGAELGRLAREIEEDERVLRRVMSQLGVQPSLAKTVGAKLVERAGRLKLNGQVLRPSPLSPVVELEGLLSGVKSKQHLWRILRDRVDEPVDGFDPDHLLERADAQIERLHDLWLDAAERAFLGPVPGPVGSSEAQ